MSDKNLIDANRRMLQSGGFVDYSKSIKDDAGIDNVYRATVATNRAKRNKIQAVNQSVGNAMSKMKSDVDLTAFSPEEQKNIKSYLVNQRNIYADAANQIAQIDDKSSPEYLHYVDVMNGVNQGFQNLKGQLDAYKENKVEFAEGVRTGMFSEGNDDAQYAKAARMFGLVDGEDVNVPFQIGQDGNLGFDIDGEYTSFKEFRQPFAKDYKVANSILKQTADLYKNHTELSGPNKNMLRLNLEASLRDPETIQSLVNDFEADGLNLSDIPLDDINQAREMIVGRVMQSYEDVARQGKSKWDAEHPRGGSGGSGGSGKSATVIAAEERRAQSIAQIQGGYDKPIPTGRRNKSNAPLFVTLNKDAGVWVLTDGAGAPVEGPGGNMLTFDTEEKLEQYIK